MKERESDFLTHKQRVKFVVAVFPLIHIILIPAIAITATNKLLVVLILADICCQPMIYRSEP